MKKILLWWRYLFLFCLAAIPVAAAADSLGPFSLARAPQRSELATIRDWQPLADYLSRETGWRFNLRTYASRAQFEQSLLGGEPDFVYCSPYYHSVARSRHGYIPLVRGAKMLQGILVVRRDSPYQTVRDLNELRVAFPSPNAFAASLYMRALLTERERIRVQPMYVETHDNVYRNVVVGRAVAGGGVKRTLSQEPIALREQLRIIYETPAVASHPVSAHPRVPEVVREAVTRALLKLQDSEEGRQLLDKLKMQRPQRADQRRDYDALESLGLGKYGTIAAASKSR